MHLSNEWPLFRHRHRANRLHRTDAAAMPGSRRARGWPGCGSRRPGRWLRV